MLHLPASFPVFYFYVFGLNEWVSMNWTVPSGGLGNGHEGDLARSSCPQDCSYGFLPPAGSVHPEAFGSLVGVIGLWPLKSQCVRGSPEVLAEAEVMLA